MSEQRWVDINQIPWRNKYDIREHDRGGVVQHETVCLLTKEESDEYEKMREFVEEVADHDLQDAECCMGCLDEIVSDAKKFFPQRKENDVD